MKKIIYLSFLFLLSFACEPTVPGELRGVQKRKPFYPEEVFNDNKLPFGMVYIPSGAFQTGDNDEDIMGMHTTQNKTFSVPAFYMDETEISNNEYRQFVYWVRDSIAREKLYRRNVGEDAAKWVNIPDKFFKDTYRTFMDVGSDVQGGNTPFEPFMDSDHNNDVDLSYINKTSPQEYKSSGKILRKPKEKSSKNTQSPSTGKNNEKNEKTVIISDEVKEEILKELSLSDKSKSKTKPKSITPSTNSASNKTEGIAGGRNELRKYFTLDWEQPIEYEEESTAYLLSDMYYSEKERFYNRKEIDTRLLFFDYYWIDLKEAAKRGKISASGEVENNYRTISREPLGKDNKNDGHRSTIDANGSVWLDTTVSGNKIKDKNDSLLKNRNASSYTSTILQNPGQDLDLGYTNSKGQHNAIRGHTDRSRFIIKERINIYPDTLCWMRDHTFSNSEHMAKSYFYSNAYDNYPVVGVTWPQAKAFSVWRTQIFNTWLQSNGDMFVNDFRLPSESEWERAARGDMDMMEYPWGGPYIRNSSGCFQANFKPMRGRYFEDGGMTTVKVYSYHPNLFGLYCMAGNVAEWCSSSFDESSYYFQHDMSAEYDYQAKDGDPITKKRKVVRGGSWKDIGYYLLNTTRTYEYQDSAKNYIGFRNVMSFLGRGGKELDKENGEEIQSDIQLK
jgi:formylglycine-generating enzyme required for sulfatase activity